MIVPDQGGTGGLGAPGFPCWLIYFDFGVTKEVEEKFAKTDFRKYGIDLSRRVYLKFDREGPKMQTMVKATRFATKEKAESRLVWLCGEQPIMIGSVGIYEWDGR